LKGEVAAWNGIIDKIGIKNTRKIQEMYGKRPPAQFGVKIG